MTVRAKAAGTVKLGLATLVLGGLTVAVPPSAVATEWETCLDGPRDRQAAFARAAEASGVPQDVLMAVSFLQSRWDDHGSSPSTSGGYGPMHLTLVEVGHAGAPDEAKGEGGDAAGDAATAPRGISPLPASLRTLELAAGLTGLPAQQLRSDDVANICGGAALLSSYRPQGALGWSEAIARYSGAGDEATAIRFAEQVYGVMATGESRVTNDGYRVALEASPNARADSAAIRRMGLARAASESPDCPTTLECESIPAPYEHYGASPGAYGNHDLADRPRDMKVDYIIIHDTEATWDTTLRLVTDPTYLAWHYSLRSSDGHIAHHLDNKNVGWHAGNWYVNAHSIGLEHEGFAAKGASWYTESLYRTSSALVRHLAAEYDVPLDRAHVIGHDQIPGILPANVRGMHWDPGPYWDWEHYFDLLGAPIAPDRREHSDVVTVKPGFADNVQPVTGCGAGGCAPQGTNFVYLHTEPSADSPLVKDIGLRPNGAHSTTHVSDIGARAAAGQKFLVAQRSGDWLGVWYLGEVAWIHSPRTAPVVVPSQGEVVVPAGDAAVPVYGRAYPEKAAYPTDIPYQTVAPLQYTIKPGQAFVLADKDLQTDYYYAKTFNCAYVASDCTQVLGEDRYYEIWFGHRMAFVRAADVQVKDGIAKLL